MRKLCILFLTIILSLFNLTIQAESPVRKAPVTDPLYQIELILYSHINATGLNSEHWPLYHHPRPELNTVASLGNPDSPENYPLVPANQYHLNNIARKLSRSPNYQVVLHVAWREPLSTLARADSPWIHLYGGKGFDEAGNVITQTQDETLPYNEAPHWQVDGLVHIDLNRYFNTHYILFFAAPTAQIQALSNTDNFAGVDDALVYFELNQKRRMRSHELNNVGHPLYGILVDIQKVPA